MNCDNCRNLAAHDRSAAYAATHQEEQSKRNKRARQKAAEAAGRQYREMTNMQLCLYRDREGKPSPDCLVEFMPKSGIQMYCKNCRRLALNQRQAAAKLTQYRTDKAVNNARYKKHLEWGKKSVKAYHARQRKLRGDWKILQETKSMPSSWQRIVPILMVHRDLEPPLSNSEVQKLAGTNLDKETMRRIRKFCRVPGQRAPTRKKKRAKNHLQSPALVGVSNLNSDFV